MVREFGWFCRSVLAVLLVLTAIVVACVPALAPTPTAAPMPTPVPYRTIVVKVLPGNVYGIGMNLTQGARIEYSFRSDLDIDFWLQDPFGSRHTGLSRVELASGQYVAEATGVHSLMFDNSLSKLTDRSVEFTYRVVPPGGQ